MKGVGASTIRPEQPPRAYRYAFVAIILIGVTAYTFDRIGLVPLAIPSILLSAPILILLGLQWFLWPSSLHLAQPRTGKIAGAIVFLLMALIWIMALIDFVSE